VRLSERTGPCAGVRQSSGHRESLDPPRLDGQALGMAEHARPWDESYRESRPAPWDLGRPQRAIVRLAERGGFAGTVLDAGCGSGEHALYLAALGHETLGVDVAPTAIEQAREKAADRGIDASFLVADALELGRLERTFDSVLDVGLFHTFDDDERGGYVESLSRVMRPGAVLQLLCFSDATPGDEGPRRVSEPELRAAFATGWNVVSIVPEVIEIHPAWAKDDAESWMRDGAASWLASIERI
jgi:SAM-dependent methyltransferase